MLKWMAAMPLLAAAPALAPAGAQDTPGAVDLGALSRGQVQRGAMEGHAERDAARDRPGPNGAMLSARSRGYCEAFPSYRSRYGASDPRVTKLAAACRAAGYPY